MEYVSLKFPNFADTARIHYASSDLARCGAQEAGFFWVSYYHYHVSTYYSHFIIMVYHIYFHLNILTHWLECWRGGKMDGGSGNRKGLVFLRI